VARVTKFSRLVAASGASNLADGVLQTVMPLVALSVTRDPSSFATVTLVGRLPWLLVALPAGALADRLDRRETMLRVNVVRVLLIGGLAVVVAADRQELWMLYVVAFALGVGETFYDTSAQSIVPSLVPDVRHLERANSRLYAVELTANQFVGPALGGLIAGLALTGGLTASAAAYLLAALALVTIAGRYRPAAPGERRRLRSDIAEGVRYLAHHPLLRALAICVGVSNLASTAMFAVFPLYAIDPGPMGLGGLGFGLLLASLAAGSVLGSFLVAPIVDRLGQRRALLFAMAGQLILMIVPAITTNALLVSAAFVTSGAIVIGWNVITVSLRQRIVPDHLLGRVNSGYRLLAWGTMPIGAALGGAVAERWGLPTTFWVCAAISAACLPIIWSQVTTARLTAAEPQFAPELQPHGDGPAVSRIETAER
jgi:MFS family permease